MLTIGRFLSLTLYRLPACRTSLRACGKKKGGPRPALEGSFP
jgi:hypothetical protein